MSKLETLTQDEQPSTEEPSVSHLSIITLLAFTRWFPADDSRRIAALKELNRRDQLLQQQTALGVSDD